jgi:mannose/fructose/N-acetylgalactosamine-specific phosphotransferase system component IIC
VGDVHAATAGALIIAVIIALAGAWLGGWSMVQLRSLNARRVRRRQDAIARGDGRVIRNLHLQGLLSDFVRGAALTAVLLAIALPLRDLSERASQGLTLSVGRPLLGMIALAVAVSAVWKHFASVPYVRPIIGFALAAGIAWFFVA